MVVFKAIGVGKHQTNAQRVHQHYDKNITEHKKRHARNERKETTIKAINLRTNEFRLR